MYYCQTHGVAYENAQQWTGHWSQAHRDEELRVKAADAFVDHVPEGTTIFASRRGRSHPSLPKPAGADVPGANGNPIEPKVPPMTEFASQYQDEQEGLLDEALDGIGATPIERQTIVKGWRRFPVLRQHPHNLETYITGILGTKKQRSVGLVVHSMFPGAEQEVPANPYMYDGPGRNGPGPMYWPGQRAPHPQQWGPEPYPYFVYNQPGRPPTANGEADPQVVALQKQVDVILGELQAERAERAREKQERDQKDRDAAWQAQLNALATKVDGTYKDLSDLVKGLGDQLQRGHSEVEGSRTQELSEKVTNLTEIIASQKDAALLTSVEGLHKELAAVQQKVNAEPTGKTTEDLLSQGIPLALEKMDGLGNTIRGELQGIRAQAAAGQLPGIALPSAPIPTKTPGAASPVETAQQIAGARQLEDEILSAVGGQARS